MAFATVIKGSAAVELMVASRPYLGATRRRQIDAAVASWSGRTRRMAAPGTPCAVNGCIRLAAVRGLCRTHYKSWWKAIQFGRAPRVVPVDPTRLFTGPDQCQCDRECDIAWLAGLLEGEGFFGVGGSRNHTYPIVSLQMCDRLIVSRAAAILGAPSVRSREPRNTRWRMTYVATLVGSDASDWMERLRPLMGARRAGAIDAALLAYRPIRLVDAPAQCVVENCSEPHRSRGLCHKHYMSWLRDVTRGRKPRITPLR